MAKKNSRLIISIISLAILIMVSVMAIAKTYFILPTEVKRVADKVNDIETNILANMEDDIAYHDDRLYEQEREVFGIKKDIGSLSDKVDRNYLEQKQSRSDILDAIKEIKK